MTPPSSGKPGSKSSTSNSATPSADKHGNKAAAPTTAADVLASMQAKSKASSKPGKNPVALPSKAGTQTVIPAAKALQRPVSHPLLRSVFELADVHPPTAGHAVTLPVPAGGGDALACASWAVARIDQLNGGATPANTGTKRPPPLLVVCGRATDANRLAEEIPWFAPGLRVGLLPDWETLPYEAFSPHQDLVSERLATLHAALTGELDVLVTSTSTALQRLAPPQFLAARTFKFKRGQQLDAEKLRAQLQIAGYTPVTQVVSPGEYAIRGGLVDLFPTGAQLPYRIDLFDDEIDQIRTFDPDTQRTVFPVQEVQLLPGKEFPFDDATRTMVRGRWRERFEGDPSRVAVYKDLGHGIASAGIEYYLPLFFDGTATLFDYLPQGADGSPVALVGDVDKAGQQFWQDTQERWKFLRHDTERPILDPSELFISLEDFFVLSRQGGRLAFTPAAKGQPLATSAADVAVERRADDPLGKLRELATRPDWRVLVLAESGGRRETLAQYFAEYKLNVSEVGDVGTADQPSSVWGDFAQLDAPLMLGVGPLQQGFHLPHARLEVLTEAELFAQTVRTRRKRGAAAPTDVEAIVRDLSELKPGDPVVHVQHGIARYHGLLTLDLGDGATEFLHLKYANDATLYVPVSQLHVISRYSGASPENAPLHTLGSGQWDKAKRKAAQQARDTAAELLNLYARRALRQGHTFKFNPHDYEAFAEGFGFDETADQLAAIHAVVQDMTSGKPMDRLICGDVGFGKTEVALRAAFVAVMDGKQVAVLTPTTLLAEQHYQTFRDRFADWPVKLAELSRFRSAKEVTEALKGIAEGKIDIIIGTHKLLSKEVKFDRLGLVIIDEEHRFGVRQKEALKALRAEVDILTLTATPIPRTLAMSMEGLRDFSVIATAPSKRLAIKTLVRKEDGSVVREALLRELKRGGQAYFLHNEVDTIDNRKAMLEALVPEARIAVAHGQMPERELERVMREFTAQRYNVLLCTTIIETGIDVPNANTIIMHRADKFGLAQLHQLRGRVGRSHHQAYAYLLVPDEQGITKDAVKRLEAIQSMEELGSGFYLAMHDLEIRGAGEVLGDNQSGNLQEVGFQLYTDMLNEAVRALKAGREPDLSAPLAATTEINLHVPALLPNDYCGDVHERLTLYKRLANCSKNDAIDDLQEELIDRFGKLPDQARALIETHRIRILGQAMGIQKVDASDEAVVIQFVPNPPIEPMKIIQLIQKTRHIKLSGQDRLRVNMPMPDLSSRVRIIRDVVKSLQ